MNSSQRRTARRASKAAKTHSTVKKKSSSADSAPVAARDSIFLLLTIIQTTRSRIDLDFNVDEDGNITRLSLDTHREDLRDKFVKCSHKIIKHILDNFIMVEYEEYIEYGEYNYLMLRDKEIKVNADALIPREEFYAALAAAEKHYGFITGELERLEEYLA